MSRLLKSYGTSPVYTGTLSIPVQNIHIEENKPGESVPSVEDNARSLEKQILETQEECRRMVERATADAAQTRERAEIEATQLLEKSKQDGYRVGYKEGRIAVERDLLKKYEAVIARGEQIAVQVETERQERLQGMSEVLVAITMESIRMLLARELELKKPDVESMVGSLIQYVIDSTRVEVRVHPDDFPAAMESHAKWNGMKFGDWEVSIVPDLQIERGGCEIRSSIGRVDATLETKLQNLEVTIRNSILKLSAGEGYVSD